MTVIIFANAATAVIAAVLMALVTIGFAPHLRFRGNDANSLMSLFVAASSGLVWARLLWWSLLRPLAGSLDLMGPSVFTMSGQSVNTAFNVWAILAALAALGALHRSLPTDQRRDYNWLTVAFYPRRFTLIWRSE